MEMNFEFERKQRGDATAIAKSQLPVGDWLSLVIGYLRSAIDHWQSPIRNPQSAIPSP
jgi:hypothetical protein